MLELKNICISYDKKECIRSGTFKAIPGNITGIYGESGTGKSSLLYVIGMLSTQQCNYYYNNELLEYNDKQKADFRNKHISFITQNSVLIETISVEKNIEFFLTMSDTDYSVDELLEMVNLNDKKNAMPNSLSGGERQRAAIACAIAKDSDIILGDELTSALDEDNKRVVMNLLRKCADKGKIVILVSHEKKVLDECDVLYKINHLELSLERGEVSESAIFKHINRNKKQSIYKTYKLLFESNRKIKRRRLIISIIVMFIVFMSVSIVRSSYDSVGVIEYSLEDVSNRKMVILSDHGETGQKGSMFSTQRSKPFFLQEPIDKNVLNELEEIENIEAIYDCYVFYTPGEPTSHKHLDKTIIATRNGETLERKDYINGYGFYTIPIYPEESFYPKEKNGVYVSTLIAYLYNLEVGDDLNIELQIPYAQARSVDKSSFTFDLDIEGKPYNSYDEIATSIRYDVKVEGIIDGNSYEPMEIYMRYEVMEEMINKEVERHKNDDYGKLIQGFIPPHTYEPLNIYSKVIFVDEYDNVLRVQNDIHKLSPKLYAYNEYQTVSELTQEAKDTLEQALKMSMIGISVFVIGVIIIEIIYLLKYNSIYMYARLYGLKYSLSLQYIHGIKQTVLLFVLSALLYITASLPDILPSLNIISLDQGLKLMYKMMEYYIYFHFTSLHFTLLVGITFLVIIIPNVIMKGYYIKRDIITWLRGE